MSSRHLGDQQMFAGKVKEACTRNTRVCNLILTKFFKSICFNQFYSDSKYKLNIVV